jgi:8-oxo-dGTP diphosphatase
MHQHKPLIVVSTVALINQNNQVLYTQRPKGKNMEGLWEFPGGKVEAGETAEKALKRELMEELSITIDVKHLTPLTFASQEYETFIMVMPLYICRQWSGDIHPNENQAYAWVNIEDLHTYPMPPADKPLLDHIVKFLSHVTHT